MKKIIDAIKKALGMDKKSSDSSSGFTLIELLVVIAVIGVLAAGILLAINPLEQIRRAQDSSLKEQTSSIGRAVEAYYVNSIAGTTPDYPDGANKWLETDLSGEFKQTPVGTIADASCPNGVESAGFCLNATAATATTPSFVVYTALRNSSDKQRAGCTAAQTAYYVYSSTLGKAGIVCTAPANNFSGTLY